MSYYGTVAPVAGSVDCCARAQVRLGAADQLMWDKAHFASDRQGEREEQRDLITCSQARDPGHPLHRKELSERYLSANTLFHLLGNA
jgi:hypothetical protein